MLSTTIWKDGRYQSSNYSSFRCPKGHYCPEGSVLPIACEAGTYANEEGRGNCTVCPRGYYCEEATVDPEPCPQGSYCLAGTKSSTEFLCPAGTYGSSTELATVDECTSCTPGRYCATAGLTSPTGLCAAGYFCGGGSIVPDPHESASPYGISYKGDTCVRLRNDTVNDICPPSHYCEQGSSSPVPCPQGTNTTSSGLTSISQCTSCRSGYSCPNTGTYYATKLCDEGMSLERCVITTKADH